MRSKKVRKNDKRKSESVIKTGQADN
ncbi:hypothetical protein PP583_gp61 [Pseudoalteromonas phage HS6]|nr:hypothetical protein PP583_gp61 [Pseudoalteromonas phage HS6]